jgi:protein-S-isoprenylcysteine O-methyltransferase
VTPPYQQPPASIAFWLLFSVFGLGEAVMKVRSRLNPSGIRSERWTLLVLAAAIVGGLLGGLGLASWHAGAITDGQWPLFCAGLALMAAGVVIRQWAIAALGRFFTGDVRVHPHQQVVDTGPYRWVRHPS